MRRLTNAGVLAAGLVGVVPQARAADVQFGPRFNVSDDADLGLGADVRWTFLRDDPRLALSASFDYFFPDDGNDGLAEALRQFENLVGDVELPFNLGGDTDVEYWEANLNLTWDFTSERTVIPYAGVGINYARQGLRVRLRHRRQRCRRQRPGWGSHRAPLLRRGQAGGGWRRAVRPHRRRPLLAGSFQPLERALRGRSSLAVDGQALG